MRKTNGPGNRCSICLIALTGKGVHMFDSAGIGSTQVKTAVGLGVLSEGHLRSAEENGMIQCASCHHGFFAYNHIALSPAPQVLHYVLRYLTESPGSVKKPLQEVFALLSEAINGYDVDLPDPTPILPYLGLYTLVPLKSEELYGLQILTPLLPELSILSGRRFVSTPPGTQPNAPNVARIFDVVDIRPSETLGRIPFSSFHPEFGEQRYWRLPVKPEVILSGLMERAGAMDTGVEEINLAQLIRSILIVHKRGGCVEVPGTADNMPSGPSGQNDGSDGSGSRKARKRPPSDGDDDEHALFSRRARLGQASDTEMNESASNEDVSGRSESPPGEADSERWEFGPSFSSNKIIFAARGQILV